MSDECRFDDDGLCFTHDEVIEKHSCSGSVWREGAMCNVAATALQRRVEYKATEVEDLRDEVDRLIAICDALGVRDLAGAERVRLERQVLEARMRELEADNQILRDGRLSDPGLQRELRDCRFALSRWRVYEI